MCERLFIENFTINVFYGISKSVNLINLINKNLWKTQTQLQQFNQLLQN
jgi:hypothetical protein